MTNKEKYIELCADKNIHARIPLFLQPFWLDAVANSWDVLLGEDKGSVMAVLPYCTKGKLFTKRIYLPDLSFYQSIFFLKKITHAQQNKIAKELFTSLPKTIKSYFKFLPEYINIDLDELGYTSEDYTTYVISHNEQHKVSDHHQRHIQKGIKKKYMIRESNNLHASFQLLTSTFKRQGLQAKISEKEFTKAVKACANNNAGKVFDCLDPDRNLLASIFIVNDANMTYYLMGGYNADFKNSGAMTFLLDHVIRIAIDDKQDFNFCGSSRKTIASYFKGFGAVPVTIPIRYKSFL